MSRQGRLGGGGGTPPCCCRWLPGVGDALREHTEGVSTPDKTAEEEEADEGGRRRSEKDSHQGDQGEICLPADRTDLELTLARLLLLPPKTSPAALPPPVVPSGGGGRGSGTLTTAGSGG